MGKVLEPALAIKQASHPTPKSEKWKKEHQSFTWPVTFFQNQLLVAQGCQGLGEPPHPPQWEITGQICWGDAAGPTGEHTGSR